VLKQGDIVRLLDESGQGTVISQNGDKVLVNLDGLEISFPRNEIVKVEHDHLIRPEINRTEIRVKDKLKEIDARNRLRKMRTTTQATYELDLHMHELLDRFDHMSNSQILEYQMSCCRRFIYEAKEKRYKKVVLIHGVGEGVLRSEIRVWLDSLTYVSYHDAAYRTYGYGATEVILWG
jgi:dsDNA-specific endonuclease/ATPase MutS2